MDGRYEESYDPDLLRRMNDIYVGANWEEEFNKQHIDYVILEKAYGTLYQRLIKSGEWRLALVSREFVLLIRSDIEIKNSKIPPKEFEHYNKDKWKTNIDWSIKNAK